MDNRQDKVASRLSQRLAINVNRGPAVRPIMQHCDRQKCSRKDRISARQIFRVIRRRHWNIAVIVKFRTSSCLFSFFVVLKQRDSALADYWPTIEKKTIKLDISLLLLALSQHKITAHSVS